MEIFKDQNLTEFAEGFKPDKDCIEYLSEIKWSIDYSFRKCGHSKCQIRKNLSRTCDICSDTESEKADTLFHRLKLDSWKDYNPIAKEYDVIQVLSDKRFNFKALHIIHQVKS